MSTNKTDAFVVLAEFMRIIPFTNMINEVVLEVFLVDQKPVRLAQ